MHAMIAISILVETGAVLTGFIAAIAGRENIAAAQAISYGIAAVAVSIGMSVFLDGRGVPGSEVWRWEPAARDERDSWWRWKGSRQDVIFRLVPLGVAGGIVLALVARSYLAALQHIPAAAEILRKSQEEMVKIQDFKLWMSIGAVVFAPFAEEYLFRGLLYRALDREWGGWRAVVGSAAFFAIYHPPLSWLPVALLGAANSLLFKKTGRLLPAVIVHMTYNAIIVLYS